jgi:hypothetical protein
MLRRFAPSSVEQGHSGGDTLAGRTQSIDQCLYRIGRVLASELLHIQRGSRASAWVAADASRKRSTLSAMASVG